MALFKRKKNIKSTTSSTPSMSTIKKIAVTAKNLIKGYSDSREILSVPDYNLNEIKIASESDSYLKIAIMKYSYMLFKAGYRLKGDNKEAVKYIKQRLKIMGFATKKPIDILFQEIGDDLIKYSNAFLVKSRVDSIMPGIKAKSVIDKKGKPIGGYFRCDPTTINIYRDKNGTITKYVQIVDGEEAKFKPEDVIHFYLDKDAAKAFGTPRYIAALEDIKILRRIEGNVMVMIYRYSIPIYQWIVGIAQPGFQGTNKEIDELREKINNMSFDSNIITNEKTSVKVIGAEGSALDATPCLKYFEQRVFTAIGVSESQMGRGGAKQDADSMESQAHDTVKYIQRIFSIFVNNHIITELLLEGGFNPLINKDDEVELIFNEINTDSKVKVENHEIAKFQSQAITYKELRRKLGEDEDVDMNELYKFAIENKAEEELIKAKEKSSINIVKATKQFENNSDNNEPEKKNSDNNEPEKKNSGNNKSKNNNSLKRNKTGSGAKKVSPNGNGTNKSQAPTNDVSNKNMPENQHGKTSVKIKESLETKKNKKNFVDIYNYYEKASNYIEEDTSKFDEITEKHIALMTDGAMLELHNHALKGSNHAKRNSRINKDTSLIIPFDDFKLIIQESFQKTFNEIKNKIADDNNDLQSVFDAYKYRIRFVLEYTTEKIFWYSYALTLKELGFKEAYIDFDGSKDEENHSSVIDLNNFKLEDLPPFHPYCNCKITLEKGE